MRSASQASENPGIWHQRFACLLRWGYFWEVLQLTHRDTWQIQCESTRLSCHARKPGTKARSAWHHCQLCIAKDDHVHVFWQSGSHARLRLQLSVAVVTVSARIAAHRSPVTDITSAPRP